jgi:hypothetical protein
LKLTPQGTKLVTTLAVAHRQEIRKHAREIIQALTKLEK